MSKSFLLVVSLGTQLRCLKGAEIIKSPAWTTTFIPVAGLDTCKWYLMRWNNYPAPSAAQLFTMLLHRKHFCFYFHYIDYKSKINATISQKMLKLLYRNFVCCVVVIILYLIIIIIKIIIYIYYCTISINF